MKSLGTKWGLFRHYWVLAKLVINVFANIVLLMYTQTLGYLADVSEEMPSSSAVPDVLRNPTAVLHSGVALLLLLVATVLSLYKPRGMTRYGQRKQEPRRARKV